MKGLLTLLVCLSCSLFAFGQEGTISGKVTDESGEALIGANVLVKGTNTGAFTDLDGNYSFRVAPGDYTITVTYIGYREVSQEVSVGAGETATLSFEMSTGTDLDMVVVSGSKKPQKLTESPATIATIFQREIDEYAGNPGELLARQKGIDYFRAGIATPAFNIRGFNSNFNSKNLQVTDGRFSSLVATGLPLGPLNTTIKEDIETIEVILGPNATLYGPNAHNGLLNTVTKDPRRYQGTTIALNGGVSGDGDPFYSARIRHAQVLSDKFAFKVTGEYTAGEEFEYVDSVYLGGQAYPELELDRDVNFQRAEASLIYSPTSDIDVTLNGGYSNSNYLSPTNVGRNQIKDWQVFYGQLKVSGKNWFAQAYYTGSQTDSTYSIDERTKQYYRGLGAGLSDAEARGAFSYQSGALFSDNSSRWNAEAQYNNTYGDLEVIAGFQWQQDQANSLGTYLIEQGANSYWKPGFLRSDSAIIVNQLGGYLHLTYNLPGGFRLLAAGRADNHDVYGFNFIPKFGLLKVEEKGTWRLTYGQGIAAPTILNMFGNLFGGLILGNAEGFTFADGAVIEKQVVEKLQTIELGYRGRMLDDKLFLDVNAFYNISTDFLSPATTITPPLLSGQPLVTQRGDVDIAKFQNGIFTPGDLVITYVNFGQVNTYGLDLGFTYYFKPELSVNLNYSFFDWTFDESNLEENDFDKNGVVNFLDVLVNAPNHKGGLGLNYSGSKFFGSVYARWVQAFNYFSSFQIASETLVDENGDPITYRGVPIVEGARGSDAFNYGPLGGFVTPDITVGYRVSDLLTVSFTATNAFNQELREFTASAPTRGLYVAEAKINLPAIGRK